MEDVKNWVVLIILVNVILLPVMWLNQSNSQPQVLGVSETKNTDSDSDKQGLGSIANAIDISSWFNFGNGTKPTNPNNKAKTISGDPIVSTLPERSKTQKLVLDEVAVPIEGRVEYRDGFKNNLAVKNFELGDRVNLKCGDKELQASVDGTFLGSGNVLGIASQSLFFRLGVDPSQIKELDCKVTKL